MIQYFLDQQQDVPPTQLDQGFARLRYAYLRSCESLQAHDAGQDYITFEANEEQISFCICDGVGLSFYGNLAARYLGDSLRKWISVKKVEDWRYIHDFQFDISLILRNLRREAEEMIARFEIPGSITGIFREVLEAKRAVGSETTFLCGKALHVDSSIRLFLAWLGDTKATLWRGEQNCRDIFHGEFTDQHRWSSRRGAVGSPPHCYIGSSRVDGFDRLVVHTDGLDAFSQLPGSLDHLREMIQQSHERPNSDDISYFEIGFTERNEDRN